MEIQKCAKTSKRRKRLIKNRRKNKNKYYNKCKLKDNNKQSFLSDNIMGFQVPDSFWETYKFAQDWQHKHQVAWWRSKCVALEHENLVLKNKIREIINFCNSSHGNNQIQAYNENPQDLGSSQEFYQYKFENQNYSQDEVEAEAEAEDEDEELEFQVDEGMMKFLEQSARHKEELKRKRELEAEESKITWVSHENDDKIRLEEATLLYGKDKSKIIAIETRMQVEIDQYKIQNKPEYWPIIPIKL